jgi:hypothetical protein
VRLDQYFPTFRIIALSSVKQSQKIKLVTRPTCSIKYRKGKDRLRFNLRFRHCQNSFLSDCMTTTYLGTTIFRNVGNTHQMTQRHILAHLSPHIGAVFAMAAPQQSCFRSSLPSRDKETATLSRKGKRAVCLQMQTNTVAIGRFVSRCKLTLSLQAGLSPDATQHTRCSNV